MSPYVDPATGVAYNKLGITDRATLIAAEYAFTRERLKQLRLEPIAGNFDHDHLKRIHQHVFQDVYEWAGKERTINFGKLDPVEPGWRSKFAHRDHIPMIADIVHTDLKKWDFLRRTEPRDFINKLSATYVKLNHMHPFPEGNGRSTQEFIRQLAAQAGYQVDYRKVDSREWQHAAARSMPQTNVDYPDTQRPPVVRLIHNVFDRIVGPSIEKQLELGRQTPGKPARSDPGMDR